MMCDMDPQTKHQHFFLTLMFKMHPAPQKRLELLDGLMTGTMECYATAAGGGEVCGGGGGLCEEVE